MKSQPINMDDLKFPPMESEGKPPSGRFRQVITIRIPSDREAFSDLLGKHWALDRWTLGMEGWPHCSTKHWYWFLLGHDLQWPSFRLVKYCNVLRLQGSGLIFLRRSS